jgi:hypothetical protein
MGYLVLRGVFGFLKFCSIIEDFSFEQSLHLHPICAYDNDRSGKMIKILKTIVVIQPRGWSKKYEKRAIDCCTPPV